MARAQSMGTIKIGYITPATGPLSLFGETDGFSVMPIENCWKMVCKPPPALMTLKFWRVTASPTRTRPPKLQAI